MHFKASSVKPVLPTHLALKVSFDQSLSSECHLQVMYFVQEHLMNTGNYIFFNLFIFLNSGPLSFTAFICFVGFRVFSVYKNTLFHIHYAYLTVYICMIKPGIGKLCVSTTYLHHCFNKLCLIVVFGTSLLKILLNLLLLHHPDPT